MCSQVLISTVTTAASCLYWDSKLPCGVCLNTQVMNTPVVNMLITAGRIWTI